MPAPFDLPFVQRAVVELALLSVGAGVLGTWIVLRGLSFYAHAVGTAAFPGLVLADGLGFSPLLGALGTAALVAFAVSALSRRRATSRGTADDAAIALVLVAALAAGVILASDVFHSQGRVERLLFGSLLVIDRTDEIVAAVLGAAVLAAAALLGRRWLAAGFDPAAARALGARSAVPDAVLLVLVAGAAVAALDAIGALLATALLVVPAATTRLATDRLRGWQLATGALALGEGVVGLWISVAADAPPGATIAALGGAIFAIVAFARTPRSRRAAAAGALAAAAAITAGCGSVARTDAHGRLTVLATTTVLGDLVRNVGGGAVAVTQILRPNTDPHDYEPRPHDVIHAGGARIVVLSGDGLDGWAAGILRDAGGHPHVLVAGAGRPVTLRGDATGDGPDPHWWHDPRNVASAARRVRDALVAADPAQRSAIDRSAARYLARLHALDAAIARCMARVPPARRRLVTDHDAFGYFAHRYGIRVVGAVIPSQSTEAQPSAGDVARLSATIRRERVAAIFPEHAVSRRLAQALARQTGARADLPLYGDTLGPPGSAGATYLGMERANADAMVRGFTAGRERCAP